MIDTIKTLIEKAIPDAVVTVSDPHCDGLHLEATVISSQFVDLSLIEQHRMVMNSLKGYFDSEILHALRLKTRVS